MPSAPQGSIRLVRFAGINLFLHWSWFLVAALEIESRQGKYSSIAWNVLEYLALFFIVTLHEFGHAFACRQVGGTADQIVLWPLGGVAYVDPPPRPGATLWSIGAGPLVNVALAPLLFAAFVLSRSLGWSATMPDLYKFVRAVFVLDVVLLAFNLLPIYPLDGGQILRSLLWFALGRGRSLLVVTILGFLGVAGFVAVAFWTHSIWFGALSLFVLMNCWNGLRHARDLLRIAKLPRREGFACPKCQAAPPVGELWRCGQCKQEFDTFQTQSACPLCAAQHPATRCLDCGGLSPTTDWSAPLLTPAKG
jgi:Zn-dependent protease